MVQNIIFGKLIVTQLIKKYPAFFMEPESSCSQKTGETLMYIILTGMLETCSDLVCTKFKVSLCNSDM
jgi:hypothetical protein